MNQQQASKCKTSLLVTVALGLAGLASGPAAMASGIVTTQSSMQAQHAAINNLTTDLGIFEYAAQKWAVDNLNSLPWNQSGSTTPITYAPRLVYDGNPALCYGSQGLTASNLGGPPVDITQQKTQNGNAFLPATFRAPYAGTYCAAIVPNATTTTVKGETIPVAGVQAILVPGNTASRDPPLKNQDPSVFAAVHGTQGNAQYHVLKGAAIMQQGPAAGQNTSSGNNTGYAVTINGVGASQSLSTTLTSTGTSGGSMSGGSASSTVPSTSGGSMGSTGMSYSKP
jgi:hypothetical protein